MNKSNLSQLIKAAQNDIKNAPEGLLRVSHSKNIIQYGIRDKKTAKVIYIKKDEIDIARRLAQKEYAQKVLAKAMKELEKVNDFKKNKENNFLRQIYDNYNPYKRTLLRRYDIQSTDYIHQWCSEKYIPNEEPFDKNFEIMTNNNIRVRSMNEMQIANALLAKKIPFRYEYPYLLKQT